MYARWHDGASGDLWMNDEALALYGDTGGAEPVEGVAEELALLADAKVEQLLATRLLSFRAARVALTL
jgi:hypothetical protein